MKQRIRFDREALQDFINLAFEGHDPSKQKVLVNIEDEDGKVIRTVAVHLSHDEDTDIYTVEWVP